ncbi:hypothetical protein E2C01_075802 [Portunus trituberculatus]|uniref:Uncharacterized protein n=1 Tax=Portunus trituberculatus TaxID=210409 RepID=A0A5B7IGQ6_PORTR|nr:hypothetical protein [Portunus trituberculatus]
MGSVPPRSCRCCSAQITSCTLWCPSRPAHSS